MLIRERLLTCNDVSFVCDCLLILFVRIVTQFAMNEEGQHVQVSSNPETLRAHLELYVDSARQQLPRLKGSE